MVKEFIVKKFDDSLFPGESFYALVVILKEYNQQVIVDEFDHYPSQDELNDAIHKANLKYGLLSFGAST